jgi:hypothetical protein
MNRALAMAAGPKHRVAPWLACIPDGADVDMTRKLLNGLGMGLMALGSAKSGDTADDICARWASIASREPFACDPTTAQSISDENLAQMIIRASLISSEVADLLARNPKFATLVKQAAGKDENASAPADPQIAKAVYDCIQHHDPLGGDSAIATAWNNLVEGLKSGLASSLQSVGNALNGRKPESSTVGATGGSNTEDGAHVKARPKPLKRSELPSIKELKEAANNAKEAAASKGTVESENISKVVDYFLDRLTYWRQALGEPVQGDYSSPGAVSLALNDVAGKYGSEVAASVSRILGVEDVGSEAQASLSSAVADTRKALEEARAMVDRGRQSLSDYQNDLEKRAKEAARLDWAQALLDAPDDVSVMLALVTPNMTSVSGALTSAFDLFRAAKKTGSAGSLYSLLRSFAKSGALNDTDFAAALSGDPDLAERIATTISETAETAD